MMIILLMLALIDVQFVCAQETDDSAIRKVQLRLVNRAFEYFHQPHTMMIILLMLALIDVQFVCAQETNTLNVQEWNSFKTQFNKQYATLEVEQQKMQAYKDNLNKVAKHNELFEKGEVTFTMGVNSFADMTAEEFKQAYLTSFKTANELTELSDNGHDFTVITSLPTGSGPVPTSKNWANDGAVTEVKDQGGSCGSCWAFTVAAAIESHNFIYGKDKKLVSLSEQNLIDCVKTQHGYIHSCVQGSVYYPFQYVIDNKGIDTEQSYPYKAVDGTCAYKAENKGASIKSFTQPSSKNEKLLMEVVGAIGPVTCVFDSGEGVNDFQLYASGIYSSKTCKKSLEDANHSTLIVGYGRDEKWKLDYWIMKNSWGPGWGENGYMRIRRNTDECGISTQNYFPIII